MKLTFFLSMLTVFNLWATETYSQMTKLSLNIENAKISDILKEIENQSEFFFIYSPKLVDVDKVINIKVEDATISDILTNILSANVKFAVYDRQIILIPVEDSGVLSLFQQRITTGTVKDSKGNPLIGVTVVVKGTTLGTLTDEKGNYSIQIADKQALLQFSFIGYSPQEINIGSQTVINIILNESMLQMDEVIVTALGIKRETKSLGYSATSVDTKQVTAISAANFGSSLSGKVAGLNASSPASGQGGSSKIRIRGQSSFGGNNSPLIVINGVPINNEPRTSTAAGSNAQVFSDLGDGLQSINPDDIESMTVLKGASAAALYGFRAKDGVIIITTKNGSNQIGIGAEVNSSFTANKAIDFTDFQYEYGGGESGLRNTSVADARKTGTWSFGTKFDGLPVWSADGLEHPYVPFKDRIKAFYNTGMNFTNSVALSGGNSNGSVRLSFANTDTKSIIPNSSFNKKIIDFSINYKFGDKLTLQANTNYSIEDNLNPPVIKDQNTNVQYTLMTMSNSIDPTWFKNVYKDPLTGNEISFSRFNNRTNMYWTAYERHEELIRNRLYGNILLKYQLTPWLYAQGRIGQDYFSVNYDVNLPTGTAFLSAPVSGFNGSFTQSFENFSEVNMDFLIGANKKVGDIGINVTFGGNTMDQLRKNLTTAVTNFYIRDLYTVGNGQIKNPTYDFYHKKVNSLYGNIDISYREFLFLNVTGRNDWFSTLNPKSNSYLYPSVSSSFVFSQAFSSIMPHWLTYGKLRASYAEVGGDTSPYTNSTYFALNSNAFNGIPFGGISGSIGSNPDLKPLKVKEVEAGLELIFFDRRISLDFAVYRKNTIDEILNIDVSNTSGFLQTKVNVGRLRNQGVEALLSFTPILKKDFSWVSSFNYTYNKSLVIELASGQERIDVGTGYGSTGTISEEVGMPMGSIRGFDFLRDSQGRIVTSGGRMQVGNIITFGSAIPKHTGGWINTFTYKGFRLFAQIDFKAGNKLVSTTNYNLYRSGLHKATLEGREGGVIFDAVNSDGTPNTTAVEAESFYTDYAKHIITPFVYDASFIKWRTVSIGYDFTRFVNRTFIKGLTFNVFINNFLVLKKYTDNIDPESTYSVSDLEVGLESASLPITRDYGLSLNVKF